MRSALLRDFFFVRQCLRRDVEEGHLRRLGVPLSVIALLVVRGALGRARIVGDADALCITRQPGPGVLELYVLSVAPTVRDRGIGSAILRAVMAEATQTNDNLLLRCRPASTRMYEMACRAGFTEVAREPDEVGLLWSPMSHQRPKRIEASVSTT